MERLSIVCWKWKHHTMGRTRPDYGAKHVNVLARKVSENLGIPHEIVCVTDDPEGIDGGVRIVPLWDDLASYGRCFRRLKAFSSEMADVLGPRFVSLDLDTVIVGRLDDLFARDEDFVIWADPSRVLPYCGSMWMVKAGSHPEVFDEFDPEIALHLKRDRGWHGSDQAWMAYKLPGAATWGKKNGVYSFRMHICKWPGLEPTGFRFQKWLKRYGVPKLPENAKIVHFHGAVDPSFKHLQDSIPWIAEHWN